MTPRLVVISDFEHVAEDEAFARLEGVLAGARAGTVLFQLRDHALGARRRLELGRRFSALAHGHGQLFAVNDRIDLALLLGADALHLGESSVEPREARALVGERFFVSRSSHDPVSLELGGADAVVLAPILAPRHGRPALGLAGVSQARAALGSGLLYALGGIDAESARACLDAGADGVAVMGAVWRSDPSSALLDALGIRAPA